MSYRCEAAGREGRGKKGCHDPRLRRGLPVTQNYGENLHEDHRSRFGCGVGNDRLPAPRRRRQSPTTRAVSVSRGTRSSRAPRLRVFLELQDGTDVSVNSDDDAIATRSATTPIPGHEARDWTFVKETEDGTSVAYALVSYNLSDSADYLMAGWVGGVPGAAVPGSGFLDLRAVRHRRRTGDRHDIASRPAGRRDGHLHGPGRRALCVRARQRLGRGRRFLRDRRVRGQGRAHRGLRRRHPDRLRRVHGRPRHPAASFRDIPWETRFATSGPWLPATSCISVPRPSTRDGTFEIEDVAVKHPDRTVTNSEGDWGGSLSNIPDENGNPRLAAGFTGAQFEESDGQRRHFLRNLRGPEPGRLIRRCPAIDMRTRNLFLAPCHCAARRR